MKKIMLALVAGAAIAILGACAESYGVHAGYYYGDGDWADAYYDDAYGPYYDGYWGGDGFFYYRDAESHPFVRDDAHHFRRDGNSGYHQVRAHGHEPKQRRP